MTTLISQGYTPLEQYSSNFGDQGPWTDIYSFAASVYHGITGKRPVDALNRSAGLLAGKEDSLVPLSTMGLSNYSPVFLSALDRAMMLKPDERPQTLTQWRSLFAGEQIAGSPIAEQTLVQPSSFAASESLNDTREFVGIDRDLTSPGDSRNTVSKPAATKKKSAALPLAGAAVLLVALGAGGWWYTQNPAGNVQTGAQLTQERVAKLPRPGTALSVVGPTERLEAELSDLKSMNTIYQQALAIDKDSQPALDGIAYLVSQYARLAESPIVMADEASRARLSNELSGLVNIDPQAARLVEQLQATPTVKFASLSTLLNKENLTGKEQQKLLAGLVALQGSEKQAAQKDDRVIALSNRFRESIVKNLEAGNFDQAARMIEVAQLINPDDSSLDILKRHLEGRG